MKISASIYSNTKQELPEIIQNLDEHQIDLFHVDCNDDISVFNDIKVIRQYSNKPVDLHIITENPEKYYNLIDEHQVEYVTFQYENIKGDLNVPDSISAKLGLAITSETDISVFEDYTDQFSFILFMATTPGKSSGIFNKENFKKIRKFRTLHPEKKIHVDGGVDGEVSFILRNMGVYAAVSGSYLFNANQIGSALLNLKTNEIESHFQVQDFMRPLEEIPVLYPDKRTLQEVLESIDEFKLAFTILADETGKLEGIVSNADVRKGLMQNIDNLNNIKVQDIVNTHPFVIKGETTVVEMLKYIKSQSAPINYLPVVNNDHAVIGAVTFINLIKGEL